jgi:drug/metabolite transporter (DMT)-like permease
MFDVFLYATTVHIWGASWLAIQYQLGVVAPEVSLVYRFALSAAIMMALCLVSGRTMRFTLSAHLRMAALGLFLFSTNYVFIYLGSQHLTSGLVAVAFSTVVAMNILLGALLLRAPIRPRVPVGAAVGLVGIAIVFWPEIAAFELSSAGTVGLVLALTGTASASLGMLTSGRAQAAGLPVIQANAYGMGYGALFLTGFCLVRGTSFNFDPSFPYVASLGFLAVFATVIGFWSYLTLLGRIGADRAAYVSVLFPIVALALSTAFEGYHWTLAAAAGIALTVLGNVLILSRGRRNREPAATANPAE